MDYRLRILVESRIRWKVYVRFGGEHMETYFSDIVRRRVLSLHYAIEKPLIYRIFDLGNLTIYTSDKTTPILHLYTIRKPDEKYQILRGLVELSRKEKHVYEID